MVEARTFFCGCFDPEDAYWANYLGGLEAINAGVTSLVDHCHLQSSPEVAEALAQGLKDSGVAGVYCYALQNVPLYSGRESMKPEKVKDLLTRIPDSWHDVQANKVRDKILPDGPLLFGVALPEVTAYLPADTSALLFDRAHALRPALVTGHWSASVREGTYRSTIKELADRGTFRGVTLLSHLNNLNDDDWRRLARSHVSLCTCPETETGMGLGKLMASHFVKLGGEACLGIDTVTFSGADMFVQARMLLQLERMQLAQELGARPLNLGYPTRAALELLTIRGARAIGQSDVIGSLAPGKRADIIIVKADSWHPAPAADPVATLIFNSTPHHIDTVLVGGKVLKCQGELVGVEHQRVGEATKRAYERVKSRYDRLPRGELATVWKGAF
jgi:cytosine/adenosine deaminase-related metal-dependent hydrolase